MMFRLLTMVAVCCATIGGAAAEEQRWVNPLCHTMPLDRNGPFLSLPDGSLMSLNKDGLRTSKDEGKTWSEPQPVGPGLHASEPSSSAILKTKNGALVIVYLDFTNYKFAWDDKAGEPKDECRLEIWAIRSLDGGKTWIDKQRLLDGYNANFFGFIQTRQGTLVASVEHLVRNPGHWVACSLFSDDDGKTWKRSNLIDLGGHGHHDGAIEPTVVQLKDDRLLMLIRTNLDQFWQAFSDDGGRHWRTIQPSGIDASSSPGHLVRLASGRLVLLWNRLHPSTGAAWPKSKPSAAGEAPMSWYREELSLAFSEDEGKTWTKPILIAREKGGQVSYPYVFERRPGELWLIAGFAQKKLWKGPPAPLRLRVSEKELLREAKKGQ